MFICNLNADQFMQNLFEYKWANKSVKKNRIKEILIKMEKRLQNRLNLEDTEFERDNSMFGVWHCQTGNQVKWMNERFFFSFSFTFAYHSTLCLLLQLGRWVVVDISVGIKLTCFNCDRTEGTTGTWWISHIRRVLIYSLCKLTVIRMMSFCR